ncbi:branched-chain amino acid ABC transporter permease [Actinomadura barringtoniae]|uniref:Branched-chain amino acid ABC transporter permease n=1 Tax=Actinomadura barringtoniae TaxID=1427535 RepID=A0A939PII1_9ACTN|nr:branched-chain amino acid ABC transporter permease [Actinomadura barringtoniae]MBO2452803.1 branched-chain amino acid ABC transporter permease [Actinomadura barringtoniae]
MTTRKAALGGAVLILLAVLPFIPVGVQGLLPGPFSTSGTLQLMALCLVFGALALTYDLLFGHAGLLSFGHALYFALGVYVCNIVITHGGLSLIPAVLLTLGVGVVVSLAVGALSLRVKGIAFAMVTLSFAQAASVLVLLDPGDYTGGEEGLGLDTAKIPQAFVGVANTRNLYWLSFGLLIVVYGLVRWTASSEPGRAAKALRENEQRATVLGIAAFPVRLLLFTVAGTLATLCGVAYLLVIGSSTQQISDAHFSLTVLVMVVLGGLGSRWGVVAGGVLYHFLDDRLTALATTSFVHDLPAPLRAPLSQPLFLLGVVFIVVVLFLPGGIAGAFGHRSHQAAAIESLAGRFRRGTRQPT